MREHSRRARELARDATLELEGAGVPEARASAEVLLSELLGVKRSELALYVRPLTDEQVELFRGWVQRRKDREPVQRILGYAYFRNLKLYLNEHALIPRPDTESVVDAALEAVDRHGGACRVLDVGTGSGAIAIAIAQERPRCEVHATDISAEALEAAGRNAAHNGVEVTLHLADMASGLELPRDVDLLVSNPPYVASDQEERLAPEVRAWDPAAALFSGPDELLFYRRIFEELRPLLAEEADVVIEIGDKQADAVMELGRDRGFEPLEVREDLAGSPRAVSLRWGGR